MAPLPSSGDSPLYVGDYFQLSCAVVHGDAPFNITWFYNDEPVNKLDGITILMQSKRSSSLNIESVRGEHAGKYTCMGANRAGATEVFTYLIVKGLFGWLFHVFFFTYIYIYTITFRSLRLCLARNGWEIH